MSRNGAVLLVGITSLLCVLLCFVVLMIMWQNRKSRCYRSFFYRCCWNEGLINFFTLIFFLTTMYGRFFSKTFPVFIYLNRYSWWTKFAQIAQEHLLYMHIMNVFLTVGGRFCIVCLPESIITHVVERMKNWEIFVLQISIPTVTVIPLYWLYEHQYEAGSIPMFLTATSPDFDQVIPVIKMTFRTSAFAISFFAYVYMFWVILKKAKRKETNILIHSGCLMSALGGSSIFDFHMGAIDKSQGLFLFTAILWIPCTNIITTFCVIALPRWWRTHPSMETKSAKIFVQKAFMWHSYKIESQA